MEPTVKAIRLKTMAFTPFTYTGEYRMKTLSQMEKRLQELDKAILETRKRLPAHSVKPPVMIDLLELEDEYDRLMDEIRELKEKTQGTGGGRME